MSNLIRRIELPELFYGIVAPIGVDTKSTIDELKRNLEFFDYNVVIIKVTDAYRIFRKKFIPWEKLNDSRYDLRLDTYIKYGNQLRINFQDGAILADSSIFQINNFRRDLIEKNSQNDSGLDLNPNAYIISQFKREEEVGLFRNVYGENFTQISIYARKENRIDWLARRFASERADADFDSYRSLAEDFVRRDFNEREESYGQRISKIFHDADFIVSADVEHPSVAEQVKRYVNLQFGANFHSPTKLEYGMYAAKSASLRSLDLSRQVGAAIFSNASEILSLGCNEVPKGGGGTYWADELFDDREYKRGVDSNDERKKEIVRDIYNYLISEDLIKDIKFDEFFGRKKISDSRFMDALEYGRIVHAEMNAITDAARNGRALLGSVLFCTTFPCHMCAKHIVAAGTSKVIFLEPYPKSLAKDLHSDSIGVEGGDRARYNNYPLVSFEHFYGVTPRRYKMLFERSKRKDKDGNFEQFIKGQRIPNVNNTIPYHIIAETLALSVAVKKFYKTKHKKRSDH